MIFFVRAGVDDGNCLGDLLRISRCIHIRTQIVTGLRPAAFISSRCFWTRFALSATTLIL
jgi:hypothetical protein